MVAPRTAKVVSYHKCWAKTHGCCPCVFPVHSLLWGNLAFFTSYKIQRTKMVRFTPLVLWIFSNVWGALFFFVVWFVFLYILMSESPCPFVIWYEMLHLRLSYFGIYTFKSAWEMTRLIFICLSAVRPSTLISVTLEYSMLSAKIPIKVDLTPLYILQDTSTFYFVDLQYSSFKFSCSKNYEALKL